MTLENQNFTISQGEDWTINLDLDKNAKKEPEDLTGATIVWKLWDDIGALRITKDADDITIVSLLGGTAWFNLTHVETTALQPGDYDHELWITDALGQDIKMAAGTIKVKESRKV